MSSILADVVKDHLKCTTKVFGADVRAHSDHTFFLSSFFCWININRSPFHFSSNRIIDTLHTLALHICLTSTKSKQAAVADAVDAVVATVADSGEMMEAVIIHPALIPSTPTAENDELWGVSTAHYPAGYPLDRMGPGGEQHAP